jgi:heme oxygenase
MTVPTSHPPAHGTSPAASPLAAALREQTAEHHKRAEEAPFQRRFVGGKLPREQYVAWIAQMLHLHRALETHSRALGHANPAVAALLTPQREKAHLLERDLAAMGGRLGAHPPVPAMRDFLAQLEAWAEEGPAPIVGVHYVLEGSTNGNRYIVRNVKRAYGIESGSGADYLDPYGESQPTEWRAFAGQMGAAVPEAQQARAVEAAQATFDAMRLVGNDLLGEDAEA